MNLRQTRLSCRGCIKERVRQREREKKRECERDCERQRDRHTEPKSETKRQLKRRYRHTGRHMLVGSHITIVLSIIKNTVYYRCASIFSSVT